MLLSHFYEMANQKKECCGSERGSRLWLIIWTFSTKLLKMLLLWLTHCAIYIVSRHFTYKVSILISLHIYDSPSVYLTINFVRNTVYRHFIYACVAGHLCSLDNSRVCSWPICSDLLSFFLAVVSYSCVRTVKYKGPLPRMWANT